MTFYTVDTVTGSDNPDVGCKPGDQCGAIDIGAGSGGGQKIRHDGRIVADFFDGHVESQRPQVLATYHYQSNFYKKCSYSFYDMENDGSGGCTYAFNGQ